MKTLDTSKPVQLRDGTPARIICTNRMGGQPIVALVGHDENSVRTFSVDGSYYYGNDAEHNYDLVNLPAFDPSKPVRQRSGAAARVLCTDFVGSHNQRYILAAVRAVASDGGEFAGLYNQDGRVFSDREHPSDLVNV